MKTAYPYVRMRRLRIHPKIRDLIRETRIAVSDCILPLFIHHGTGVKRPIQSMPGHYQFSVDYLAEEIREISRLGIPAVMLFGIPEFKDARGSGACRPDGVIQRSIAEIKNINPDLLVIADCCFCEYTDHGHCGVLDESHEPVYLDNDQSLAILAEQALSLARAGADVIAPSGMLDGMVKTLRLALDQEKFEQIPILSYAVKYASSLYGPFREAAQGAPRFGDRRNYQMDPANGAEALREAELDVAEGADMLIVKPASFYLDIIHRVKNRFSGIPLCAYQVSGEFAMIKAAAAQGWLDANQVMLESLIAIKRAGADFIITYFAKDIAACLN